MSEFVLVATQPTCIRAIKFSFLFTCKGSFVENCWVIYWQRTLLFSVSLHRRVLFLSVKSRSRIEMQFCLHSQTCTHTLDLSKERETASKFGQQNLVYTIMFFLLFLCKFCFQLIRVLVSLYFTISSCLLLVELIGLYHNARNGQFVWLLSILGQRIAAQWKLIHKN